MLEVFTPSFPLSMELNALEKPTNNSAASRFFARDDLIVRIWEVVDQFLWKPLWIFQRIFSTKL